MTTSLTGFNSPAQQPGWRSWLFGGAAAVAVAATASSVSAGTPYLSFRTSLPATVDENGVDLATGQFIPPTQPASIGSGQSGMSDSIGGMDFPNGSQFIGAIHNGDLTVFAGESVKNYAPTKIHYGNLRPREGHIFTTDWTAPNPWGASVWTTSDGTVIEFTSQFASDLDIAANYAAVTRVTKPDGEILDFGYNQSLVPSNDPEAGYPGHPEYLIKSNSAGVQSSLGWNMGGSSGFGWSSHALGNASYPYVAGTQIGVFGGSGTSDLQTMTQQSDGTYTITKQRLAHHVSSSDGHKSFTVKQFVEERRKYYYDPWSLGDNLLDLFYIPRNASVEYEIQGGYPVNQLMWTFVIIEKVEYKTQNGATITALYDTPTDNYLWPGRPASCPAVGSETMSCVKSITRAGKIWKYTWGTVSDPIYGYSPEVDIEDPSGKHKKVRTFYGGYAGTLVTRLEDEEGRVTRFEYNEYDQVTKITHPEGNYEQYTYDIRGNLTESRLYPKDGGAPLVETAGYDTTCANHKTCNKPNWTKDAKGNQTDYTYSADHGGVLSVTGPADTGGVRPQTRYEYAQQIPKVINASNILTDSPPVWRLVKESSCRTATAANPASCVGTVNEQVKTYEYIHNNLLLTSTTVRTGNANTAQPYSSANLWQTVSYGYDVVGNTVWVDGPLTGDGDKTYTTYDYPVRRPVFEIGVDPDGGGPLKRAIVKHTYNPDGQETLTETGTGSAITFSNGVPTGVSDFVVTSFVRNTYEPATGLLIKTETVTP